MLSVRCPVCLSCPSACDVRALWPNGWTDQDETWHEGRPQPWPHCVRWGPSSPSLMGHTAPQFSARICCGQMAAWIKMSLGRPRHRRLCVRWGPAPPPQRRGGQSPPKVFRPCLLRPNVWMDEAGSWQGRRPQPRRLCVRWGPSPLPSIWQLAKHFDSVGVGFRGQAIAMKT